MAIYNKDIGYIPLTDAAGITKVFNKQSHLGLDIGWWANKNCPVLAWQDGLVVDKGYSQEVGYFVVLEHRYTTTKRWTGYIHLTALNNLAKGVKVEGGKPIGNAARGNTGVSNGVHLHLYLTQEVPITTTYTWDLMKNCAVDPYPFLYWDKSVNTDYIAVSWAKEYPKTIYPKPVERNEEVEQVDIKSSTRRLRNGAGLKYEAYRNYATPGIYNVHGWTQADGYDWALIDTINNDKFYAAIMEGEDLPVADFKDLYEKEKKHSEELAQELKTAQEARKQATDKMNEFEKELINAKSKLKSIKEIAEA